MKVLLIAECEARAQTLRDRLTAEGHAVFVDLGEGSVSLAANIASYQPHIIVVDADSLTRATVQTLADAAQKPDQPLVLCVARLNAVQARDAIEAGAHALMVGEAADVDFAPALAAASAQFERIERLKAELAEATQHLQERKVVERAKGILMQTRGMTEDEAYRALRRTAMERKMRLAAVAEQVITVTEMMS